MMQFASSRRDAVDVPYVRREIWPSLRTGSAERRNWKWKKKSDVSFSEVSEKNSDSTGCVTAWKSEEGEPIMELMEDIVNVLERLERRIKGRGVREIMESWYDDNIFIWSNFPSLVYTSSNFQV